MMSHEVGDVVDYEIGMYEKIEGYYDQEDPYEHEARKDNAQQLRWRSISESKKKLSILLPNKQNRHYINVRNKL